MDFANTTDGPRASADVLAQVAFPYESIILASITGFLIILLSFRLIPSSSVTIKDETGRAIKAIQSDSRVAKFIDSLRLSAQGRSVAGNEPYLIYNGRQQELVISRPDHVKDFYKDDTKEHPKPHNLNMGAYFGRILGDAVGVLAGERWSIIRKHFDPEFSFKRSRQSIPMFINRVSQWADQLHASSSVPDHDRDPARFVLDASKPSKFVTFELVAYHLYGEKFNDELYKELLEINKLHEVVLHDVILNNDLTTKLGSWLNRGAARRMTEYNRAWKAYNMKIINRARQTNCPCPVERIFQGVEQGELRLTEFLHTLDEVLFANVEVSAAVLNTLLANLAANQDFQSRLRDEVTSWDAEGSGNLESFLSKQDTLLNFAVMESMRLSPAFSFSLPECTSTDKKIGGYKVPANTAVVIDARRLNADPDSWGADGGEFRPERFRQMPLSKCRYSYMRFGTGGASGRCLGKNVADIVFKLTVMEVLKRFSLSRPDGLAVNDVEFIALGE